MERTPLDVGFMGRGRTTKFIDTMSQHKWRVAMVVLTVLALIMLILFGVDAGFKFNGDKKVIPGVNKWTSVVLSGLSIIFIPIIAYIYKYKGATNGLIVHG